MLRSIAPAINLTNSREKLLFEFSSFFLQLGSVVHTDQWAAYRQLQRILGLQHGTVNHSLHFVDSVTGVHTQHAESNWCTAKEKLKSIKGSTNPDFLMEYLQ